MAALKKRERVCFRGQVVRGAIDLPARALESSCLRGLGDFLGGSIDTRSCGLTIILGFTII